MTGPQRRMLRRSMPWIFMALFLALWEIACVAFAIEEIILPRPSRIFAVGLARADVLLDFCLQTLWTTFLGFIAAIAGGLLLGLVIGASPLAESSTWQASRAAPVLAGVLRDAAPLLPEPVARFVSRSMTPSDAEVTH